MNQRKLQNVPTWPPLPAPNGESVLTLNLDHANAIQDARIYAEKNGVQNSSGPTRTGIRIATTVLVYHPPRSGNHVGQRLPGGAHRQDRTSIFAGIFNGGACALRGGRVEGLHRYTEAAVIASSRRRRVSRAAIRKSTYWGASTRAAHPGQLLGGYLHVNPVGCSPAVDHRDRLLAEGTWTAPACRHPGPQLAHPAPTNLGPNTRWNSSFQPADAWLETHKPWSV